MWTQPLKPAHATRRSASRLRCRGGGSHGIIYLREAFLYRLRCRFDFGGRGPGRRKPSAHGTKRSRPKVWVIRFRRSSEGRGLQRRPFRAARRPSSQFRLNRALDCAALLCKYPRLFGRPSCDRRATFGDTSRSRRRRPRSFPQIDRRDSGRPCFRGMYFLWSLSSGPSLLGVYRVLAFFLGVSLSSRS